MRCLVHAEWYDSPVAAVARDKQVKGWRRDRKVALVESVNPDWRDLSAERLD